MSKAPTLRQVLAHLQKASVRLQIAESERPKVLSALLLSVAVAGTGAATTNQSCKQLYQEAQSLLAEELRAALPLPSDEHFEQAKLLLPAPPHAVAQLDECVLGYLYQFFCSPQRLRAKALVQSSNKESGLDELIYFTQLYTPTDIVDFLLEETIPLQPSSDFTLIDPACGAGNFLWRTFDLLFDRYAYARLNAQSAAQRILGDCLSGSDIDDVGLWICALGIAARLKTHGISCSSVPQLRLQSAVESGLQADDAPLGSLSRQWPSNHVLGQRYDAVVGNPPYLGRKLLDRRLKTKLKKEYPKSHSDLCNAFIERGLELLKDNGHLGYITQGSLLYLPTYGDFRKYLIENFHIQTVVEAGSQVFPLQTGEKVNSILLVIAKQRSQASSSFVDAATKQTYNCQQEDFLAHRANAFNYRCPPAVLKVRNGCGKLEELTEIRQGLATSDNGRFIRFWWQVPREDMGTKWFPYVKGGGSERWYCPTETVIDWRDGGAELKRTVAENYPYLGGNTAWVVKNERFYFREGLTFSLVNTKALSVRYLPPGCIFDVAGSALFPDDGDRGWMLGYLNSAVVAAFALILNPTINYQVGDLKQLPVVPMSQQTKQQLSELAKECVNLKRSMFLLHDADSAAGIAALPPPSEESCRSLLLQLQRDQQRLLSNEREIDNIVFQSLVTEIKLDGAEAAGLQALCEAAVERRKLVAAPIANAEQFARLYLRMLLYEAAPALLSEDTVNQLIGTTWLFEHLGMPAFDYVRKQLEADQLKMLHGTRRIIVHPDGNGVRLFKPYDRALTVASEA